MFYAIANIACAVWIGAIVFQSMIVAPTLFKTLDESAARSFLRTVFPRFFRLGLGCGGVMLVSLLAGARQTGTYPGLYLLLGLTAAMVTLVGVSLAQVPAINAARDAGASGAERFERLHKLSVGMTVVTLLLGLVVLGLLPGIGSIS